MQAASTHTLTVLAGETRHTLVVPHRVNLRRALLMAGLSPYAALTRRLNCGGRGLCATCGVWLEEGARAPAHWHDRLAAQFGYPRLSCQITVTHDMLVRLVTDKRIWGRRDPARRWPR
ncbi:MAG TPA: 2Fe-2S iron-sulfur cluster-binding protein [Chloroflexaceae bacterium]|nr:2Fe-2S iron-sulfur cluster-binding protein [Chloroflexaceae bacterium]